MEKVELGKYCPLFKDTCKKGLCAWWIEDAKACTLPVLTDEIGFLDKKINELINYYYSANEDKIRKR